MLIRILQRSIKSGIRVAILLGFCFPLINFAQHPPFWLPSEPSSNIREKEIQKFKFEVSRNMAGFRPGKYTLPQGDSARMKVRDWMILHQIPHEADSQTIYISSLPYPEIFTRIIDNVWTDLNSDEVPDLCSYTDAYPLLKPYKGGLDFKGLQLDKNGILLRADNIYMPPADSARIKFKCSSPLNNTLQLRCRTSSGITSRTFLCTDTSDLEAEFQFPLADSSGNAWLSLEFRVVQDSQVQILLQNLELWIPESEQFVLIPEDTLFIEPFGMLNYKPRIFTPNGNVKVKAEIISGPQWVNADEKGYIFGRATCPEGIYSAVVQYKTEEGRTKIRTYPLCVKKPARQEIPDPAHNQADSLISKPESGKKLLASGAVKSGKRKKGSKSGTASKGNPSHFIGLQASLDKESGPSQQIRYTVKKDGYVSLYILNGFGDPVRTIIQYQKYMQGKYSIRWDGSNDAGESLAGGEYECKMEFLPADGTPPHSESCRVLKVF